MTYLGHCDISGDRSWYMEKGFPFRPVEAVVPVVLRVAELESSHLVATYCCRGWLARTEAYWS
jgi:hypothetical protein